MWKNQLKVTNKPSLRTDVKPIPQPEEKGDCLRWLRGLYDLYEKHSNTSGGMFRLGLDGSPQNQWLDIPEELACDIKLYLETSREIDINGPSALISYNQYLFEPWLDKYDIWINSFANAWCVQNNVVVESGTNMLKMQLTFRYVDGDGISIHPSQSIDMNLAIKEIYKYMGRHDLWIKYVNNFENNIWDVEKYGRMATEIHNSLKW